PDILCMVNFISAVNVTTTDDATFSGVIKRDDDEGITLADGQGKERRIARADGKAVSAPIYHDLFLGNYALINVKDELLRVDGVSDVSIMGERDYSVRIWLDPQKLAARGMSAGDVANAIRSQNLQAAAGQIGQPPVASGQTLQLPLDTLGRLADPEQFGNIIVKVGPNPPAPPALGAMPAPTVSVSG